jgi:hypothetical protein
VARQLTFSEEERGRLAVCCKALGTSFEEFAHFATMQAVDEVEGYGRDIRAMKDYYEGKS